MTAKMNQKLAEFICEKFDDCPVVDVIVGLTYTKVTLADGRTGISYTFSQECGKGCCPLGSREPLAGRSAQDLVRGLSSEKQLDRSVALATSNALCNAAFKETNAGDVLSADFVRRSDSVAMVGYFGPLVDPLKKQCRKLYVFDKDLSKAQELSPLVDMPEIVQQCDVTMMTSTAIANDSAEEILFSARHCRETVLLGASTPLVPAFFSSYNVTMLSGVVVTDDAALSRAIKEGRGMRSFKGAIKKVNVLVQS